MLAATCEPESEKSDAESRPVAIPGRVPGTHGSYDFVTLEPAGTHLPTRRDRLFRHAGFVASASPACRAGAPIDQLTSTVPSAASSPTSRPFSLALDGHVYAPLRLGVLEIGRVRYAPAFPRAQVATKALRTSSVAHPTTGRRNPQAAQGSRPCRSLDLDTSSGCAFPRLEPKPVANAACLQVASGAEGGRVFDSARGLARLLVATPLFSPLRECREFPGQFADADQG